MPGWDTPESAGQRSTSRSSKPSGPPGGGATSQGSGRDHSPSPSRDPGGHHRDTPVAIVQDQRTGEVKVVMYLLRKIFLEEIYYKGLIYL